MSNTFQTIIMTKPGSRQTLFLLARRGVTPDTLYVIATFHSEGSCRTAMMALNKELNK